MDKPLEFLKKYWKNNHYTDITENPEPDFNSNFFIAIRNLMSDFNIYANSEGKTDDLKSGDCNMPRVTGSASKSDETIHYEALKDCCNKLLDEVAKGNTPRRQLTGLRLLLNR